MDKPIVCAHPDQALCNWRFGSREHRVVILRSRIVDRNRPARWLLLALVIAGQVRTDRLPMHAAISCLKHALSTVIERVGIMWRDQNRCGPLKAMLEIGCAVPVGELRQHRDISDLSRALIESSQISLIITGINNVGIRRIWRDVPYFPAAHGIPIGATDRAFIAAAGDGNRAVVLLRAVDVVRRPSIGGDVVELRGRLILLQRPGLAAVKRDSRSAVIRSNHAARVFGINPESVVVAVRNLNLVEGAPTIGRSIEIHVQNVGRVGVLRIGDNVHVVPRTLGEAVVAIHELPSLPTVVRAVEPAFLGFNQRISTLGIGGNRHTDAPVRTLRQPMFL